MTFNPKDYQHWFNTIEIDGAYVEFGLMYESNGVTKGPLHRVPCFSPAAAIELAAKLSHELRNCPTINYVWAIVPTSSENVIIASYVKPDIPSPK